MIFLFSSGIILHKTKLFKKEAAVCPFALSNKFYTNVSNNKIEKIIALLMWLSIRESFAYLQKYGAFKKNYLLPEYYVVASYLA